ARTGIPEEQLTTLSPELAGAALDLSALRAFGAAVYAATGAFLADAADAELERLIDDPFGEKVTMAQFLSTIGVVHAASRAGDISALKGVHGLKGIPF